MELEVFAEGLGGVTWVVWEVPEKATAKAVGSQVGLAGFFTGQAGLTRVMVVEVELTNRNDPGVLLLGGVMDRWDIRGGVTRIGV